MRNIEVTPHLVARFFAKVSVGSVNQCWPFTGLKNKKGYGQIGIGQEMVTATHVALTISGLCRPSQSHWALHVCDNPQCCNPRHLYWGTVQDNVRDMWTRKAPPRKGKIGEENNSAKLTEADVREMRASGLPTKELAAKYGVCRVTALKVVKRETWKHVV